MLDAVDIKSRSILPALMKLGSEIEKCEKISTRKLCGLGEGFRATVTNCRSDGEHISVCLGSLVCFKFLN